MRQSRRFLGTEVTLCTIEGGGPTWPGGIYATDKSTRSARFKAKWKELVGKITQDISANDAMWEFFQNHPLPAEPKNNA